MKTPILMAALAAATLAMPASAALVASYTFDTGTVSGSAVTNTAPGTLFDGTLSTTGLINTTTPLSGDGSLDVSAGSRMTINGGTALLNGWKGIDVQATVNLDFVDSQRSIINVGHAGNGTGNSTRFRLTVRDGGKIFVGLRFGANSGDPFIGYYAGSATGDLLISAGTTYDIGVAVDATGASSSIPGSVQIRYKLASSSTWIYPTAVISTPATITSWADGWTGASLGAGIGSQVNGLGENFDGRIDNLTISQIPEPGSFVLLGLSGLLLVRRKR